MNQAIFVPANKLSDMDVAADAANMLAHQGPIETYTHITAADMFSRRLAYSSDPLTVVYHAGNWNGMPEGSYAVLASQLVVGMWMRGTDGTAAAFFAACAELDLVDYEGEEE